MISAAKPPNSARPAARPSTTASSVATTGKSKDAGSYQQHCHAHPGQQSDQRVARQTKCKRKFSHRIYTIPEGRSFVTGAQDIAVSLARQMAMASVLLVACVREIICRFSHLGY